MFLALSGVWLDAAHETPVTSSGAFLLPASMRSRTSGWESWSKSSKTDFSISSSGEETPKSSTHAGLARSTLPSRTTRMPKGELSARVR